MSESLEKEVQLHERNAQGQDVLIYPLPPGGYPLAVAKGGTGAADAATARGNLGITPGNIGAAASDHTHSLPDLDGTLPVTKGGTGAADAATARTNLGAASSDHTHALTGSDITGTLPLSKGGTGQTSAEAVRSVLGLGNTTGALPVANGGTGAENAASACGNLGAVKKSGDTMTGNLSIQGYLYPSVYLLPTYNDTTNRTVFEGSYVGASSFSAWEDSTGGNRRMLEVRTAAYEPSLDNAVVLRSVINSSSYTYRVFHAGMATPVPVGNGGTGASDAAGARSNLDITPGNIGAAASSHTHALTGSDITGTLPVAKGGTGATDAAAARTILGAAASGHTHALTGSEITGTLPLSKGGTGQTSAASVRNALGLGNTTGALPVANGGTGATSAKAALTNLGIFYADTLPSDGTDGQICLGATRS